MEFDEVDKSICLPKADPIIILTSEEFSNYFAR